MAASAIVCTMALFVVVFRCSHIVLPTFSSFLLFELLLGAPCAVDVGLGPIEDSPRTLRSAVRHLGRASGRFAADGLVVLVGVTVYFYTMHKLR